MEALELVEDWPVPHVSAAVVTPHGVVDHRGELDRRYRLASLSKVISAWAVLVAVEEGSIDLDEPAGPPGATVRHLLCHAAGYGFDSRQLLAPPGRTRIYSNPGYEVLGEHVTARTGIPFGQYVHEAVAEPLGMTTLDTSGSPAHGHRGTTADLIVLIGELLRPRLLAPATAAEAIRAQLPALAGVVPGVGRFDPCPWGLGPEIKGTKAPHWTGSRNSAATFGHFGGAGTMFWVDPVADVGLVALTDRPFDDWHDVAMQRWPELADAVLDEVAAVRA